jgi:hypothetical protein
MAASAATVDRTATNNVGPERKGAGPELPEIVIVTGAPWMVFPFKLALTKSVTTPALLPAVKVTGFPDVEFSVPMDGSVRVHE